MSSASAAVRFPDGTVKWTVYSGTSDILRPLLFDNLEDAWATYRDPWPEGDPEGPVEEVTIYADYGGGFCWKGTASRDRVIGPLDVTEVEDELFDEGKQPEWFRSPTKIGDVVIVLGAEVTNPYTALHTVIGQRRAEALRAFKDGKAEELFPEFRFWHAPVAGGARPITDPSQVDWRGLRDDNTPTNQEIQP